MRMRILQEQNNRRYWTIKLVETKTTKTGTNFEGNRAGCICNGTVAVANSHNAGPAYCVGYCGNNGAVTRNANANLARTA